MLQLGNKLSTELQFTFNAFILNQEIKDARDRGCIECTISKMRKVPHSLISLLSLLLRASAKTFSQICFHTTSIKECPMTTELVYSGI